MPSNPSAIGQRTLELTMEMLSRYPQVEYVQSEGKIEIKGSPDGFDIEVRDEGQLASITTSVWHNDYEDPEDASMYAIWLLSTRMRIKVTYRGKTAVRSVVESLRPDGSWTEGDMFGLLFPFFGKKRVVYLSNSVVDVDELPYSGTR